MEIVIYPEARVLRINLFSSIFFGLPTKTNPKFPYKMVSTWIRPRRVSWLVGTGRGPSGLILKKGIEPPNLSALVTGI